MRNRDKVPELIMERREMVGCVEMHITIYKRNRPIRIVHEEYEVCIWMDISLEDEPINWVQTEHKNCGLREAKKICSETLSGRDQS